MSSTTETQSLRHPNGHATVEFLWSMDRYEHCVRIGEKTLHSIPGLAQDAWPVSPPLQQLSVEEIDGREVAFGVGSAGTSHWSLSVEPTAQGFRFDWACRTKQPPGFLGTTYQHDEQVTLNAEADSVLAARQGEAVLTPQDGTQNGAGTFRWSYEVTEQQST